ncbi:MAG TPA: putative toxin-antitoxin system toxin component, PIN family [Rhizomicrobium sp.]|nr:putative toxin-antitoxin system toxin component, PIN family [Rhizomicrobium sp.]
MRAVIDTNVLVSGLLWRGPPHLLIELVRDGSLALISSPALLAEFAEVIGRAKFRTILSRAGTGADDILAQLRQLAEIIDPPPLPEPVSRDPDDDMVLALAIAARCDLIVTGDADLLILHAHAGIPIVTAVEAIARITA